MREILIHYESPLLKTDLKRVYTVLIDIYYVHFYIGAYE